MTKNSEILALSAKTGSSGWISGLFPSASQIILAFIDVRQGLGNFPVWITMATQEIRQRYRRTTLGPLWLTISTAALILGMGPLYSRLFGQAVSDYFPFLTVGYITWLLISTLISDACVVFSGAEGIIKQIKLPLTLHVFRSVSKNLLIYAHNLVVVAAVLVFFPPKLDWQLLLIPIGIALLAFNGVWLGILLGMVCSRFRDVSPIVASVIQVAFFLTPVMWQKSMLKDYQWFADINPLYHFLELVRQPMLGQSPDALSWIVVVCISLAGSCFTMLVFARFRARIAYWV
jgi:ABC-type polysaccharide/polyol phosphate export permease